jgi:membrane protein implicated in regulation of membrane protease activity
MGGSNALARAGLSWIAALATGAAVVVAAALTLVFAATLAVAAVLASVLFALYALALRSRRNARRSEVIEARRVGHSWVAYGWNKRAR